MNTQPNFKEMDVHYKDGTIRCKHCGRSKRGKWPLTLQDMIDGVVHKEIEEFKLVHDRCALDALRVYTN